MECLNGKKGLQTYCEKENPLAPVNKLLITAPDFAFDTFDAADTIDEINAEIAAGNIVVLDRLFELESQDTETNVIETSTGRRIFNFNGVRGTMYTTKKPLDIHKNLLDYTEGDYRFFEIDENGNLRGTSPDGVKFQGFSSSYFHVDKLRQATGDEGTRTAITIQWEDYAELDKMGVYFTPDYSVAGIKGVVQIDVTFTAISTNTTTAYAVWKNNSKILSGGTNPAKAISGLVAANFRFVLPDGTVLDDTSDFTVVEQTDNPGYYDINGTTGGLVAGSEGNVKATAPKLFKSDVVTLV